MTFSLLKGHTSETIQDKIMAYALMAQYGPVTFRSTRELLFVQLASPGEKEALVDFIKLSEPKSILKEVLLPPNRFSNTHFERLPIKLEINNIHSTVRAEKVKEILESLIDPAKGGKLVT